jgi:hypothetical protein
MRTPNAVKQVSNLSVLNKELLHEKQVILDKAKDEHSALQHALDEANARLSRDRKLLGAVEGAILNISDDHVHQASDELPRPSPSCAFAERVQLPSADAYAPAYDARRRLLASGSSPAWDKAQPASTPATRQLMHPSDAGDTAVMGSQQPHRSTLLPAWKDAAMRGVFESQHSHSELEMLRRAAQRKEDLLRDSNMKRKELELTISLLGSQVANVE